MFIPQTVIEQIRGGRPSKTYNTTDIVHYVTKISKLEADIKALKMQPSIQLSGKEDISPVADVSEESLTEILETFRNNRDFWSQGVILCVGAILGVFVNWATGS